MAALCLFIAGRSHSWIETSVGSDLSFLSLLPSLVPDLERLYVGNGLIYGEVPSTLKLVFSITYGIEFAVAVMCCSAMLFQRRDIP
jgi:hypothetical protein